MNTRNIFFLCLLFGWKTNQIQEEKLQAVMVIIFVVCGFFLLFDFPSNDIGHGTLNIQEIGKQN